MTLSAIEISKLKRRLPIYEEALLVADKWEEEDLLKKINKARKALGMPKFVRSEKSEELEHDSNVDYLFDKEKAKLQRHELNQIKYQRASVPESLLNRVTRKTNEGIAMTVEAIVQLKNEHGLNDSQIASKLNVSNAYIYMIKKRHINVRYREIKKDFITPESYCDMRNDGYTEDDIARHFGITYEMLKKFRNERTKFIYKLKEGIKLRGKNNERVVSIIERYNNGEKFCEIGDDLGLKQSILSTLVNRKAYRYYVPTEDKTNKYNLTPEKYIAFKELGYSDTQIIKEYGVTSNVLTIFKRERIESYYEIKNK